MGKPRTWSDEQMASAVAASRSVAEVLRTLGLNPTGSNYGTVHRAVERLNASTSHFTGQGWNTGEDFRPFAAPTPDDQIFVQNSSYTNSAGIKRRLLRQGVPYECSECGISEWRGSPLSLQLEHRNGTRSDNRRENLCLLCPNCHSQTPTFCRPKSPGARKGVGVRLPSPPPSKGTP